MTGSTLFARTLFLIVISLTLSQPSATATKPSTGIPPNAETYSSKRLAGEIVILDGVYTPTTAEHKVLPFMEDHRELFEGATVLDIGTGSGIIALYAARLGAKKVIATDIDETAIECATLNAETFGYSEVIEPRLVPPSDMSAYSVAEPGETFDVIVSNPPYFLDFDARASTTETDTGDLGFSIIRGLEERLTPDGQAVLLYGSTFYHQIIAKFAEHQGYAVESFDPDILYSKEVLVLFNYYLQRIIEAEGLAPDDLRFRKGDITALVPRQSKLEVRPDRYYAGIMVIKRKDPVD